MTKRTVSSFKLLLGIVITLAVCGGVGWLIMASLTEINRISFLVGGLRILVYAVIGIGIIVLSYLVHITLKQGDMLKAQKIMARGGPKTLAEYLFLFPGACPKCGSRDRGESVTRHSAVSYDSHDQADVTIEHRYVICIQCHHEFSEKSYPLLDNDSVTVDSSYLLRVDSPYLSEEEAAHIPNFGNASNG